MKLIYIKKEDILNWMMQGKKIICFGAGKNLINLAKETAIQKNILWIADNNPNLWNTYFTIENYNIPVKKPKTAFPEDENINVIITTPYYLQVYHQLTNDNAWGKIHSIYYLPSKTDNNYLSFCKRYPDVKLQNKIAFRSGLDTYVPGDDCNDNAMAIFEYIIANHINEKYELVWFVHNPNEFVELASIYNVKFVSYEWEKSDNQDEADKYFMELCTAKYFFFTDTHFWLRYCNSNQMRVNLWHGCGFKDRKVKSGPNDRNYDLMTVTSQMYADIHSKEYGISRNKVIDTGLAKEDLLFNPPLQSLSSLLDIPKSKKYIFWLPTFRMATQGLERLNEYVIDSSTGLPLISSYETALELNEYLEKIDVFLIIKLHPVQDNNSILKINLSRIRVITNNEIAEKKIQVNSLLSKADALISDYSSVAVDFILLDRPIAFVLEDVDLYKSSRGFVFENIREFLPGKELYNFDDFINFIKEVSVEIDSSAEKRRRICKLMHTHQDNNNCKRIIEAVGLI